MTDYKHVSATIPYNSADVITTTTNPHEDVTKLSKWAILLGNETIDEWAKQCPLALKTIGLFLKAKYDNKVSESFWFNVTKVTGTHFNRKCL